MPWIQLCRQQHLRKLAPAIISWIIMLVSKTRKAILFCFYFSTLVSGPRSTSESNSVITSSFVYFVKRERFYILREEKIKLNDIIIGFLKINKKRRTRCSLSTAYGLHQTPLRPYTVALAVRVIDSFRRIQVWRSACNENHSYVSCTELSESSHSVRESHCLSWKDPSNGDLQEQSVIVTCEDIY